MTHFLQIIDNILSPVECTYFMDIIAKSENKIERPDFASYYREKFVNHGFANEMFKRITPYLPNDERFLGVNEVFRISKYDEGGEFKLHKDGFNQSSVGRSYLTLNIFLNDDFEGGETDFYMDDKQTLRYSAKPKAGRGALFYSQQYHCGNKVLSGKKYLLRTDVMI
jgi:prolyl 4-hydroxylase